MEEQLASDSGRGEYSTCVRESEKWYAIRVCSRHEKVVSLALRGRGYEEFPALRRVIRRWSDRVRAIDVPLFPGYVFCRLNALNPVPVLSCPGVVSIVGYGRRACPVSEAELDSIRSAIASGMPIEPWEYVRVGQRVKVRCGSMAGVEGIVQRINKHTRLIMSVSLLQRSVALEIDTDLVQCA
jgi:transcription antitermination factor NusG